MSTPELDNPAQLHKQFLDRNPTAFARISELYLVQLTVDLQRRFPSVDTYYIENAVGDAFLDYYRHPERFNPALRSLSGYLFMSAYGDLLNTLEREKVPYSVVELDDDSLEYPIDVPDGKNMELEIIEGMSPVWQRIRELFSDPRDVLIAEMILNDVRETSQYGKVLGIAELPPTEVERQVKRHKDRIKAHMRRHLNPKEFKDA